MGKATDQYGIITAKIMQSLKTADPDNWSAPWHRLDLFPKNAKTGQRYKGVNVFAFMEHTFWGTYKQWAALGAQVRKGEKSTIGVYYGPIEDRNAPPKEDGSLPTRMLLKPFAAFHADQVDGWDAPSIEGGLSEADRVGNAEKFFGGIEATVKHKRQPRAFYTPSSDEITMPVFESFTDSVGYYSTLAHEFGHWTGHESRLSREGITTPGLAKKREQYAFEELVAELTAAFTMADLGLSAQPRQDHAEYLKFWLQVLSEDDRAFARAASQAEKAAKFLAEATAATPKGVAA